MKYRVDQEALYEAMCRANPDVDGDLMEKLYELSPETAETVERLVHNLPQRRRLHVVKLPEGMRKK